MRDPKPDADYDPKERGHDELIDDLLFADGWANGASTAGGMNAWGQRRDAIRNEVENRMTS